jgi:hypothetical protein
MYASTSVQKTALDFSKATGAFTSWVARLVDSITDARNLRKAQRTAHELKTTNKDFANVSYHDLVQWIMDEENPRLLDGTPVNHR